MMDIISRARALIKARYIHATDHETNAYESMLKLIEQNEDLQAELATAKKALGRAIELVGIAVCGACLKSGYRSRFIEDVPELHAEIIKAKEASGE